MTQQGSLQESVRAITGTSGTFNEDLDSLFKSNGGGGTTWNEKALRYFRGMTGAETISEAMNRFARNQGAYNWGSLGAATWPARTIDFIDPLVHGGLTFTRASSRWTVGQSGELLEFGNNDAGFDSALKFSTDTAIAQAGKRGYINEEARTNEARSSDMSGAVVGEIGAGGSGPTGWSFNQGPGNELTWYVLGTGTEDGWPYIDLRMTGTNNTGSQINGGVNFLGQTDAAAAQAEGWSASIYMRCLRETDREYGLRIVERSAAGGLLAESGPDFTPTLERQYVTHSTILSNASTAHVTSRILARVPDGDSADDCFRLYAPQLEEGAFSSSPIIGSGGPNTRAVDQLHDLTSPWLTQGVGTAFIEASIMHPVASTALPRLFEISDGTALNAIYLLWSSPANDGRIMPGMDTAGAQQLPASTGFQTQNNIPFKMAIAWNNNDFAMYADGNQIVTDNLLTVPGGLVRTDFFNNPAGSVGNGHLHAFAYWKQRLTNTQLADMTKRTLTR